MSTSGASSALPIEGSTDGRAAVVSQDWNSVGSALPPNLPTLSVRRGEELWIFHLKNNHGLASRRTGDTITKGKFKYFTNHISLQLPIEVPANNRPFQSTTSQNNGGQPAGTVLQETLRELWRMIPAERDTITQVISGLPEQSRAVFFHRHAERYADVVHQCMVPQARTIMANGNFNVEQLRTLPTITPNWPKFSGVYLIIYGDFGGRKCGNTIYHIAIYVGQTIGFQQRQDAHQRHRANGDRSTHYTLAANANQVRMVPLIIQNTQNVPEAFLDIAEFSMVALLGSWYAALHNPLQPNAFGAYSMDHEACMMFSRLMMVVSNRTGWRRGPTYGLNWNTPIVRHPNFDMKWTSWYEESVDCFVYRTRRTIVKKPGQAMVHWHASTQVQIPKEVADDAGFENGQPVHLVVEVRKRNGEYLTHAMRYVRFPPMIGRNPELEKLRSLAVKIQWLPKGTTVWKQYYIERSRLWQPISNTNDVLNIYRTGLMLLNDVEKVTYTGGPAWLAPLAPTGIQFLRYNHLKQKLVVETVQTTVVPWPQDNTIQQNTLRLQHLFPPASSPDTVIGAQPAYGFFPRLRKSCDLCLSQRTTTACTYDPSDHSCKCCRALRRPCTWSRSGLEITDLFVHNQPLEELGIAVNISRDELSQIKNCDVDPIELDIEGEDHSLDG
ncbi:hypothetical protein FAUST_1978 [Fusarium austroamericanum]|uniref:Uncharacterized protein n=1 Tax=Fusarium austroamericanum TaxID=282268 RepID=A0AAN6C7R6_FUSAU|nr:hypothetical protein FAUST_1978 [Fusarium austroamericanum]